MNSEQQQRGGAGSSNYQAARDIRFGLEPSEVREFVEDVVGAKLASARGSTAPRAPSPLRGWIRLTPEYLRKVKPRADLGDYFDGAAPDWRDICHHKLQARPLVDSAVESFRTEELEDRSLLLRFGGATGDGKSTALRQTAAKLAHESYFDVIYWRNSIESRFSEDAVDSMMGVSNQRILVVSDDAEGLLEDIDRFAGMKIHEEEVYFHFLLAGRDVDWFAEQNRLRWKVSPASRWAPAFRVLPPLVMGRVGPQDARVVAGNWLKCSASRPGRVDEGDMQALASLMHDASRASQGRQAFMGALLALRFDSERLRLRLSSLLSKLEAAHSGAAPSLADLLLVLAVVDLSAIDGVPRDVAARFLEIVEADLRPSVEVPLKREFFLGSSTRHLFSRHPSISRGLLEIALADDSSLKVEASCSKFVSDVVGTAAGAGFFRPGFGKLIDLGRRVLLHSGLPAEFVGNLAVELCRTACRVNPTHHMGAFVALSQCLRSLGRADEAISEVWEPLVLKLDENEYWSDFADHARGTWIELSATLGMSGNQERSFWAATVSLSDRLPTKLEPHNVVIALNQLALNAKLAYEKQGGAQGQLVAVLVEVEALCRKPGVFHHESGYPTEYLKSLGIAPVTFGGPESLVSAIRQAENAFRSTASPLAWCDKLKHAEDDSFDLLADIVRRLHK